MLTYTIETESQANGWVGIKKYRHVGRCHVWALWSMSRHVLCADAIKVLCHGKALQSMGVNSSGSQLY